MKKIPTEKSMGRLHKMGMTIILYNIIVYLGWGVTTVQCQSFIQTGTALHNSLCVSMDEKVIAIGTDASEIGLWDVNTRKKIRVLKRGKSKPRTYDKEPSIPILEAGLGIPAQSSFSPDGRYLAFSNAQGFAIWDVQQTAPLLEIFALPDYYDISKDIRHVAIIKAAIIEEKLYLDPGTKKRKRNYIDTILVYSIGQVKPELLMVKSPSMIKKIRFIPGTSQILVLGSGGDLQTIDWASGKKKEKGNIYTDAKSQSVTKYYPEGILSRISPNVSFAVHPKQNLLCAIDNKNILYIYNFDKQKIIHKIELKEERDSALYHFEQIEFTSDGKFIFGIEFIEAPKSFKRRYCFWSVQTGKEVKSIETEVVCTSHSFNINKGWFAISTIDNKYRYPFSISVYRYADFEPIDHFNGDGPIAFFPVDDTRLVYLGNYGIDIHNINPPEAKEKNNDGQYDTEKPILRKVSNQMTDPVPLNGAPMLMVQPNTPTFPVGFIRSGEFAFDNMANLTIWNWETLEFKTFPISQSAKASSITQDGRFFIASEQINDYFQVLVRDDHTKQTNKITGKGTISNFLVNAASEYLVVQLEDSILLYSMKTFSQLFSIKSGKNNKACSTINDTLAVFDSGQIELLKLPDNIAIKKFHVRGEFQKFSSDGKYYFCQDSTSTLVFYNGTGNLAGQIPMEALWVPFETDNFPSISPDGKKIAIMYNFDRKMLGIYDLKSGKLLFKKDLTLAVSSSFGTEFIVDHFWKSFAAVNDKNGITVFDLETGQAQYEIFCIGKNDFLIKSPDHHYMATHHGAFEGIAFEKDDQIYNFDQFDLQFNRPDLVLAHIGLTPPEKIELFKKAYEKRRRTLGIEKDSVTNMDFHVPIIQFEQDPPVFTDKINIKLPVIAADTKEFLDKLSISVNGVPIFGRNGYALKNRTTKTFRQEIEIPLLTGDNVLEMEIFNQKAARSMRVQHTIRCEAPISKPDLYVVAIGVSTYTNKRKNLRYAVKDAKELAQLFQRNNTLYNNVILHQVLEDDFTKAALQTIKKSLLNSKPSDHVIVFFAGHGLVDQASDYYLSTTDVNFENPTSNGISYEAVEDLLDSIPARHRVMMIDACFSGEVDKEMTQQIKIENTNQGDVLLRSSDIRLVPNNTEAERVYNLMREWFVDLRPGSGATVLSSASALQTAAEGEQWKNGVFTWCLLNGLRDRKADKNGDGAIMISELQEYLATEVPKQTSGRQQPAFRVENLSNDWQIW